MSKPLNLMFELTSALNKELGKSMWSVSAFTDSAGKLYLEIRVGLRDGDEIPGIVNDSKNFELIGDILEANGAENVGIKVPSAPVFHKDWDDYESCTTYMTVHCEVEYTTFAKYDEYLIALREQQRVAAERAAVAAQKRRETVAAKRARQLADQAVAQEANERALLAQLKEKYEK